MNLIQIVYISEESAEFSKEEFSQLVAKANLNNASNSITGALYYGNGHFIQILEGPDKKVIQLYAKIMDDSRHKFVRTLVMRPTKERNFGKWGMGKIGNLARRDGVEQIISFARDDMTKFNGFEWSSILKLFREYAMSA